MLGVLGIGSYRAPGRTRSPNHGTQTDALRSLLMPETFDRLVQAVEGG